MDSDRICEILDEIGLYFNGCRICELLDEISLYFYGCYRNAGGGTRACEKFHDYMCAVDDAKKLILRQSKTINEKAKWE